LVRSFRWLAIERNRRWRGDGAICVYKNSVRLIELWVNCPDAVQPACSRAGAETERQGGSEHKKAPESE